MRNYFTRFRSVAVANQNDGTITSGTAGEMNHLVIDGTPWEAQVIGTQTILVPVMLASASNGAPGADFGYDGASGDGVILTPFCNHSRSPLSAIIGTTEAFYVYLQARIATVGAMNPFMVGFKATAAGTAMQAHTATWADYTDKACIGIDTSANVDIHTALNNAADVETDTTADAVDATIFRLKVLVSAAGVVTYQSAVSDAALATPATVAAFTFDSGDYVVPFIWYTQDADAGTVELLEFGCGFQ